MEIRRECRPNAATSRLVVAAGVSLAFHVLLLAGFGFGLPLDQSIPFSTLEVRFFKLPANTNLPLNASEGPGQPSPPPVLEGVRIEHGQNVRQVLVPRKKRVDPTVVREAVTTAGSNKVELGSAQSQPTSGAPVSIASGSLKHVTLGFEILSGVDEAVVGKGVHQYTAKDGESYGLSIKQSLDGRGDGQNTGWSLQISGSVTPQGLMPLIFEMSGDLPERLISLRETPEKPSIRSGYSRSGRMPDGILDRQSLLYQFMNTPPNLSGGSLWLTDGTRNSMYSYRVIGLEKLTIPSVGTVGGLKLQLETSGSTEKIELWLMPELHYLPAKLRHTDWRGVVTEQVIVSIDFE